MMGIQETFFAFIMMLCGGSTGSDALDYVDSEHYWKTKKVEYTVEEMMLEAKKPDVSEESAFKEAEIRKLLAIRALGEKKAQKALPMLKELIQSKEPFVADYAKEAIARIEGKAVPKLNHADHWKKAVAASPADTSGFVHLKLQRPKEFNVFQRFKAIMDSMMAAIDDVDEEEMQDTEDDLSEAYASQIYPILEQVGNIRVESATLAFSDKFGPEQGWVTLVVQGQYNKLALTNFLNQSMGEEFDLEVVDKVPFFTMDENASMGFVSDSMFVSTFGPNIESMPRKALVEGLSNEKPSYSAELQALVQKTDKSGPTWASLVLPQEFKANVPFMEPFKTLRLETEIVKGFSNITITGEGDDAEAVAKVMGDLEKDYAAFLKEGLEEMQKNMQKSMEPMIKLMKSIEFKAKDKEGNHHG
eukprot:Seg15955.1 transcript_id=Seg15955.1/GoldUCD/mRNA.D3Y31 product="hypothetical protein" protein_id=Seg15955.1/GoldUCD/D3Y31